MNKELANYYDYINDNPVSLVPYSERALAILAKRAREGLNAEEFNACINLAGPQSSQGWAGVYPGKFDFPRDHGPHFDIRDEWLYLAGNFYTGPDDLAPISLVFSGRRRGIVPPFMQKENTSHQDYDVWLEQVALTVPGKGLHTNRLDYILPSEAKIELGAKPFKWNVTKGDTTYKLYSEGTEDTFPMIFEVLTPEFTTKIRMTTEKKSAYFLEGLEGCSPCISGLGYRYYSWPLIKGEGQLGLKDGTDIPLNGTMWLDHQWESRLTPFGYLNSKLLRAVMVAKNEISPLNPRWNWFFFQLFDKETNKLELAVTTAKLPADPGDGKGPFTMTIATYINPDISYHSIIGKGEVTYRGTLLNKMTNTVYPYGWHLKLEEGLDLELTPTFEDQFLGTPHDIGVWEGGVTISGTRNGKPVYGYGFAEMLAYESQDTYLNNVMSFLKLPPNQKPYFEPQHPDLVMRFAAMLVLVLPVILLLVVILVSVFKFKAGNERIFLVLLAIFIYLVVFAMA